MSTGWELAVDADALHFLLAARRRDRETVLRGLESLVREPHQPCDFSETSPNQRDYSLKVMGRFVTTYGLEPEKIVRVVRISRVEEIRH